LPFEKLSNDFLGKIIIHELVHWVQDLSGKYPEMEMKTDAYSSDREEPWEIEADKLENLLLPLFKSDCSFEEGYN